MQGGCLRLLGNTAGVLGYADFPWYTRMQWETTSSVMRRALLFYGDLLSQQRFQDRGSWVLLSKSVDALRCSFCLLCVLLFRVTVGVYGEILILGRWTSSDATIAASDIQCSSVELAFSSGLTDSARIWYMWFSGCFTSVGEGPAAERSVLQRQSLTAWAPSSDA